MEASIKEFPQLEKKSFPVTGMSCAACASSVESILSNTEGVSTANVNFATNSVWIEYEESLSEENLQNALRGVGYDLIIDADNPDEVQEELAQHHYLDLKRRTIGSALLTLPVFVLGMFFMDWVPGRWISLFLAIPILFYFGRSFSQNAWKQATHGKANMDTLVALSTAIAFLFSAFNTFYPEFWLNQGLTPHVYYEAATVIITFILLGKLWEEKAKSNTSSAIKRLMGLQPKTLHAIIEGEEREIPISQVQKGYTILVKPGEKIAVDGLVTSGKSYVDESMISGEPVAVLKSKGNEVFAGTVNQKGSFQFTAEKVGGETLLAQIIKMVQEAQGSKAPVQKLVDKIAGIFVPIVLVISLITFASWMLLGGEDAFTHALLTSVAVLVIACPCALGLATPTAIMVGIGKGAEHNILIKDAESLELGHKVDVVVLDKTGTITEGKPTLTDIHWASENSHEQLASILLGIESQSEHPLAGAVVNNLLEKGYTKGQLRNFQSVTGKGVSAEDMKGQKYLVGNLALLQENQITVSEELLSLAASWQSEAKTVIFFSEETHVMALIAIADKIKDTSEGAISNLQNKGIEVHMLTGDNIHTAHAVAEKVGLSHVRGEVLPSEKAEFVKKLQSEGKVVAMVGDGINDSQALAQADVSIAMGHGSDIAMDVAKMTLITSDLQAIPKALAISSQTVKGIRQNLFWAFIYNLIGIPIAAGLLYPLNGFLLDPMIAGGAMALSSVSVITNSLRISKVNI